jgi:hypothetical protein
MNEQTFQKRLEVAKCDVSIVGSFSDIACFAVDCADREGRDIVVGIATGYGLGIEFRWGQDFPYQSRPSRLYSGYRIFPRGKWRTQEFCSVENRGQREWGSGDGSPLVKGSARLQMSETCMLIRLLRMCFPRNSEFSSALSKLRNFGGGGG